MKRLILGLACVSLSGCGLILEPRNPPFEPEPVAETPESAPENAPESGAEGDIVRPQARPENDETEAAPAEVPEGALGRTVASLGDPAEPGLWLRTPLVQTRQPGKVFYAETGKTVAVTLIPIDGPATAGSRLSLQAMQELGAPLTSLPEVDVSAG